MSLTTFYLIAPDRNSVVTSYHAIDTQEAWELVRKHFCQPSYGREWSTVKLDDMKRQGFRLSRFRPLPVLDRSPYLSSDPKAEMMDEYLKGRE